MSGIKIFTRKFILVLLVSVTLAACGGKNTQSPPTGCTAPEDIVLVDIQSVVDWINAMEKPLTLPCFLQSLPRPLATHSALSIFSAQPSVGRRSPRVFFFFDDLILTVAVDQDSEEDVPAELETHLLEMSFLVDKSELLTAKGEIKFPVISDLSNSAPYQKIDFGEEHSSCFLCHPRESAFGTLEGQTIFQSVMLRSTEPLPIAELFTESALCDPQAEPHRCAMLSGITDHGDLVPEDFPPGAPTIFEN